MEGFSRPRPNEVSPRRRGFTLIEMLTVIAIIGILAAILIPTVRLAMQVARKRVAQSDIQSLRTAIAAYQLDFGAPPPDNSAGLDEDSNDAYDPSNPLDTDGFDRTPWPEDLSPNECLVWFLTREFSPLSAVGIPSSYAPPANWDPTVSRTVYSAVTFTGSFDLKAKQTRDIDHNGFSEFIDPWGRPYMYRAYLFPWAPVTATNPVAEGAYFTVVLTLDNPSNFINLQDLPETPYTDPVLTATGQSTPSGHTRGRIQLHGFAPNAYNGAFDFEGELDSGGKGCVKITFNSNPGNPTTFGEYRFLLHNENGVDLYSLGPNGVTRAAGRPIDPTATPPSPAEWQPVDKESFRFWVDVWGTPGDGNDILDNGNILSNERERDDIANWE
jgi:prepilin-type N-terminal cleavage/methylation domain-containing protein